MRKINQIKNRQLKQGRGASFEDIVLNGVLLDVRENLNYKDQYLMIYEYQKYVWVVVVGESPDRFITLYKSRKFKKEFGI